MSPSTKSVALHPYACTACRNRKVKCNRLLAGCSNCERSSTECVYLARQPRKANAAQHAVQRRALLPANGSTAKKGNKEPVGLANPKDDGMKRVQDDDDVLFPSELRSANFRTRTAAGLVSNGRLLVAQGKSRYLEEVKAQQVANLERILGAVPEVASNVNLLPTPDPSEGRRSPMTDTVLSRDTYESLLDSRLLQKLWEYYVNNVDILIKVIYKPETEKVVSKAIANPRSLDAQEEALQYAIRFAAVTTMSPEECKTSYCEERRVLLLKYQTALEDALDRSQWRSTQDLLVMQALTLWLACSSGKGTRESWLLSGSIMGLAQAMGLHRDGVQFSLSFVEAELHRRIWWTLCILDNRISDECGLEVHVPMTANAALPLHVNDSDLESTYAGAQSPVARTEFTEMTVSLIKMEIAEVHVRMKQLRYMRIPPGSADTQQLLWDKIARYESRYASYLDRSSHVQNLFFLCLRVIVTKLWRYLDHETNTCSPTRRLAAAERLIAHNIEILEITNQLPDHDKQYGWIFRCKEAHWHAMAELFTELYHRTELTPTLHRALGALEAVLGTSHDEAFDASQSAPRSQRDQLCQAMRKLVAKHRLQSCAAVDAALAPTELADKLRMATSFADINGKEMNQDGIGHIASSGSLAEGVNGALDSTMLDDGFRVELDLLLQNSGTVPNSPFGISAENTLHAFDWW